MIDPQWAQHSNLLFDYQSLGHPQTETNSLSRNQDLYPKLPSANIQEIGMIPEGYYLDEEEMKENRTN